MGGHGGEQAAPRAAVSAIRFLFPPWNPLSLCVCESLGERPAEPSSHLKRLRSWHGSPVSPAGFEDRTARSPPNPTPSDSGLDPTLGGLGCLPAPWDPAHPAPGLGGEELASLDAWTLTGPPREGGMVLSTSRDQTRADRRLPSSRLARRQREPASVKVAHGSAFSLGPGPESLQDRTLNLRGEVLRLGKLL